MPRFFHEMVCALDAPEPFALAIIAGAKGSSPQRRGAKALFFADGRIVGTLGGGCLEAEVRDRARQALITGKPEWFELLLDHDFGWDDGLICGGKVQGVILPRVREAHGIWRALAQDDRPKHWGIRPDFTVSWAEVGDAGDWLYREHALPPCALWIAGSGHVAQAVAPLGVQLDFEVTVFDDRPALASHRYFPEAVRLRVGDWDQLLAEPMPVQPVFGLIVTRGHNHDASVLRRWIGQPFAFLGMIGSTRKRRIIFSQFLEEKLASEEQLNRVACPVGVDIRATSVPEIAVSVVAQLIKERAAIVDPFADRPWNMAGTNPGGGT